MLETLFSPAEFAALKHRDLSQTVCVVFDILRATTSMMTALSNGAHTIIPVSEISEAVALRREKPEVLLAGEREGLLIRATQSGGIDFDLGNSPREFLVHKVQDKTIVITTTNGTRALQACVGAKKILIGSFLNLGALQKWLDKNRPENLLLVCAGTFEEAAYEDTLAAGALADLVWSQYEKGHIADSSQIARQVFLPVKQDVMAGMPFSRNARRLLANPELCGDVAFCLQRDTLHFVAEMQNSLIRRAAIS